ncbi:unnamed protein product, partial [Pelagomonas calceolata]
IRLPPRRRRDARFAPKPPRLIAQSSNFRRQRPIPPRHFAVERHGLRRERLQLGFNFRRLRGLGALPGFEPCGQCPPLGLERLVFVHESRDRGVVVSRMRRWRGRWRSLTDPSRRRRAVRAVRAAPEHLVPRGRVRRRGLLFTRPRRRRWWHLSIAIGAVAVAGIRCRRLHPRFSGQGLPFTSLYGVESLGAA